MKKRTKQVQKLVDELNIVMKDNLIIDEYQELFSSVVWLLLRIECYAGYNYFYEEDYTDTIGNVTKIERLAGTSEADKLQELNAYVQLY